MDRCDAKAIPLGPGRYRRESTSIGSLPPPPPDAVTRVELEISESEVTVEYTKGDGRSYRATYAIVGRGKTGR